MRNVRNMASSNRRGFVKRFMASHPALFVIGLCGLVGVLVDVDHLISIVLWKYWLPQITEGRILHTPIFVISCLSICYLGARLRGLYPKLVLIGVVVVTVIVLVSSPWFIWRW